MTAFELPPDSDASRELRVAVELARTAGVEVVRLRRGELGVEMKPGDEPVTIADKRASEIIVGGLHAAFPDDPIISEELPTAADALAARRVWLVDPIDGTKDFIRGGDGFAVMIGLVEDGVPVLGVVHQPTIDRTFYATFGRGAFVWTAAGGTQPLAVSEINRAAEVRLVASASHRSDSIDRVKTTLGIADEQNIGSVGIKLCLIALGTRDLYVNPATKTKAWDTAGPQAILEAAGGKLTDLDGKLLDYRGELPHRRGLVATNGHVHAEVIGKLAPLFRKLDG